MPSRASAGRDPQSADDPDRLHGDRRARGLRDGAPYGEGCDPAKNALREDMYLDAGKLLRVLDAVGVG